MIEGKNRLQLLPEKRRKIYIKSPGENKFLYIGAIFLGLVVVLVFFVNGYKNSLQNKTVQLDAQIKGLDAQRNKDRERELQDLSKQVSAASSALNNHSFWSKTFSEVENLLGSQVQVINLNASLQKRSISFTAVTTNYTNVARQIASFLSNDSVKNVLLKGSKLLNNGKVEFNMELEFDDKFVKQPNT